MLDMIQKKPPYVVPSMDDIRAVKHNGLNVVSTFAGCGGSSTGYRMAGYRVLWVNEFIEAARDVYKANAAPHTIIDGRDIREVQASEVLTAIGMKAGQLDILDGSPPCASFSTAGKREKAWGKVKKYSDGAQISDDLFFEFARLVDGIQPRVFVAENVSGLVKGTAKGYFLEILSRLKGCGYNVKAKLLDAQWLGVPQARQRIIFIGVRNDLGIDPVHPTPLPYNYSVRDALPWVKSVSCLLSGKQPGMKSGCLPAPTVTTGDTGGAGRHVIEAETDISRYAIGAEWDKIGEGGQSEKYFQLVRADGKKASPTITASGGTSSLAAVTHPTEKRKFSIAELKRICAFPDDFILSGTYAQQWERLGRAVPPVMMSHIAATIRDRILKP